MSLSIQWDVLTAKTWHLKDETGTPLNLLQSKDYAAAHCAAAKQICRLGRLSWDGVPAGFVQLYETGALGGALHTVTLDRGPVWYDGFGTSAQNEAFFRSFADLYPRRLGRMRRIIPELEDTPANRSLLDSLGFKRKAGPGYKTLLLDLTQDLDDIRAGMRKSWRATLKKAESRSPAPDLIWDDTAKPLAPFAGIYMHDRKQKGYSGPSPDLLQAFGRSFGVTGTMPIGLAMLDGRPAAGVLILRHGSAATYQVGWTLPEGRDIQGHHLLLWDAIQRMKADGVTLFDLGGINEAEAGGVTDFKRGLAGKQARELTLAGFYT